MSKPRIAHVSAIATSCLLVLSMTTGAMAQNASSSTSAPVKIDRSVSSVELITKTSRLLVFDYDVPELVIDNQNIIRATPIASNKVLLTALKPGFATITASDANKNTQTLNILVRGDVRALEMALRQHLPNSNIYASALETGVVLSGTLANANDAEGAVVIAGQFFPTVINNIKLPDSQLIAIEVKVYEVARTKVRELGLDWQLFSGDVDLQVFGAANPSANLLFSVVGNNTNFNAFLQALERRSLARLMDSPVLVTMNGRPAEFLQGGEIPFEVNQGLGNTTIEFRPFGTKLDVVPIVQGEGSIRLEVRAEVSEPDVSLANNSGVSGFRVRRVNTGVEMKIGHTLVLAGDIREETESEIRGIPWLMDLPLVGRAFSRVEETRQEVELVMLLTPRFIGEVDPSLMPAGGPGRNTVSPSNSELYRNGQIEVPRCGPECGSLPNQPRDPMPGYYGSYGQPVSVNGAGAVPNTLPANPSTQQWQNKPAPTQARNGFGYPTQSPSQPVAKTASFSLKDLIRR